MRWPLGLKHSRHRVHRYPFIVIGLTGSIAMGKSTTATLLRTLGVPVFDADAVVHDLMKPGTVVASEIEERFPEVIVSGGIDRQKLGSIVFADPKSLSDLEHIIHPRTRASREQFLHHAARQKISIVALDIPLLFESKSENLYDAAMVVSAPAFLQKQRALARPGMTEAKLKGILAHQMPDAQKRLRADVVVPSGLGKRETLRVLAKFLKVLKAQCKRRYSDGAY